MQDNIKFIAIDKIGDILTVGITDLKTDIPMFTLELYKNCQYIYNIIPILIKSFDWEEIFPNAYIEKEVNWMG